MLSECPVSKIETSGRYVGLPDGIMGNSEVGHMNIGAGRIVKQDLVRINDAILSDQLHNNSKLQAIFKHVKNNDSTLHLIGLISDGGVHSHLDQTQYILDAARDFNVERITLHVITDGRDTSPTSGIDFARQLEAYIQDDEGFNIASICGRYYAMEAILKPSSS
jgi:2,3-bisphosphoglycerate-independent phosphoglycerate mutase